MAKKTIFVVRWMSTYRRETRSGVLGQYGYSSRSLARLAMRGDIKQVKEYWEGDGFNAKSFFHCDYGEVWTEGTHLHNRCQWWVEEIEII